MKNVLLVLLAIICDEPKPESVPNSAVPTQEERTVKKQQASRPLDMSQVVKAVCNYYGLTLEALRSKSKTQYLARRDRWLCI